MQIELLPTEFCVHVAVVRGRSSSPKTWKAYGHCLLPYLRFMERNGFSWEQPSDKHLAHYRSYLERKGLVRATIARVLNIVCDFYEWAHTQGRVETLPFTREIVTARNRGMLAHIERSRLVSRSTLVPRIPSRRRFPHYFNRIEQEHVFSKLSERDQLMMEWALYTGAREFEVCALKIDDIPSPTVYRSRRSYALKIVGKGGVIADLCVPTWLMDKTYRYIRFFGRPEIARASRSRGKVVPNSIFLSRWGNALKPDSLYRAFRIAVQAAGLQGTFHDLRHTFAISTLHKLMQLPRHAGSDGVNALLDLKYLLRHVSLTSTQVYLEARNFYLTEIYAELYELPDHYQDA